MAFISQYQHRVFLETLDRSIAMIEEITNEEYGHNTIDRLRREKDLLLDLYCQCDSKTQQLKRLISRYQYVQKKMRVELRIARHRFGQQ